MCLVAEAEIYQLLELPSWKLNDCCKSNASDSTFKVSDSAIVSPGSRKGISRLKTSVWPGSSVRSASPASATWLLASSGVAGSDSASPSRYLAKDTVVIAALL